MLDEKFEITFFFAIIMLTSLECYCRLVRMENKGDRKKETDRQTKSCTLHPVRQLVCGVVIMTQQWVCLLFRTTDTGAETGAEGSMNRPLLCQLGNSSLKSGAVYIFIYKAPGTVCVFVYVLVYWSACVPPPASRTASILFGKVAFCLHPSLTLLILYSSVTYLINILF